MMTLKSFLVASLVVFMPLLGFGMEGASLTDDPGISKTVILALNDSQNSSGDTDKRHGPGRFYRGPGGFPFAFYPYGFSPWGFYPYGYGYGYPGYWILGEPGQDERSGSGGKDVDMDGR
jgi:hypothetical protein